MQRETAFKAKFLPLLKKLPGVWVLKTQEVARSGVPDILACLGGRFVAIELKTDDGVVSKLQRYNLDKIEACGGVSLVITPSNFIEKLKYLQGLS